METVISSDIIAVPSHSMKAGLDVTVFRDRHTHTHTHTHTHAHHNNHTHTNTCTNTHTQPEINYMPSYSTTYHIFPHTRMHTHTDTHTHTHTDGPLSTNLFTAQLPQPALGEHGCHLLANIVLPLILPLPPSVSLS